MNDISVINESTVVEVATDLSAVCRAIDFQVKEHFAPSWLIKKPPSITTMKEGNSKVLLVDDHAALSAYHDVYDEFLTVVFVKESIDAGYSWTVTLSHEILEAIFDPNCDKSVKFGARIYALEVCAPVQGDDESYEINGIKVSDFITPEWFTAGLAPNVHRDFTGCLFEPRTALTGSYYMVADYRNGTFRRDPALSSVRPGTSGRSGYRINGDRNWPKSDETIEIPTMNIIEVGAPVYHD